MGYRVSPGVTVREVDSYMIANGPGSPRFKTQGFKRQLLITNWSWWDANASDVHKWLNENTEYGTKLGTDAEPGQMIKFKHEKELTAFLLRWR